MSRELYTPLISNDPQIRHNAAKQLTKGVLEIINTSEAIPPEEAKQEVDYAVNRLIKGLASGRESARFGFAVVLTEILRVLLRDQEMRKKWGYNVDGILELINKWTEFKGEKSNRGDKSEEKDRCLGRLFGAQAVLQAGVLHSDDDDGENRTSYKKIVDIVLEIVVLKSWLRESAVWALCSTDGLPRKYVAIVWQGMIEQGLEKTIEGVGMWIYFNEMFPGVVGGDTWGGSGKSPLNISNLAGLARILRESGSGSVNVSDTKIKGKGNWNPKLHWVWDRILGIYVKEVTKRLKAVEPMKTKEKKSKGANTAVNSEETMKDIAPFPDFWRIVVDESLFSASSSEERKFHGFLFFDKVVGLLIEVTPSHHNTLLSAFLPHLFSRNFLRCLINHLSNTGRYLHKSASRSAKTLTNLAEKHPFTVPTLVRCLCSGNGTTAFDHLTKTKTVEKLLSLADAEGSKKIIDMFAEIICKPLPTSSASSAEINEEWEGGDKVVSSQADGKRQWAADQIVSMIRSGKSTKQSTWLNGVIDMFALFGHFNIKSGSNSIGLNKPEPPISDTVKAMFRRRLFSVLGHLSGLKDGAIKWTDEEKDSIDRGMWGYRAVRRIKELDRGGESGIVLAMELDEDISEAINNAWEELEKIRKKTETALGEQNKKEFNRLQSLELLYSLVLIQTYNGEADALDLLDELKILYRGIMGSDIDCTSKTKLAELEERPTTASDVLVEILLSFLSKPSVLLRKIAGLVWKSFVSGIGINGLRTLIEILETPESLKGQEVLFDKESVGDDDEIIDIDDMSDLEVFDMTGNKDNGKTEDSMDVDADYRPTEDAPGEDDEPENSYAANGDDTSIELSAEEDAEEESAEELRAFENALSHALCRKPVSSILGGDEGNADSDATMGDSEMEEYKVDEKLSAVFKARIEKLGSGLRRKKEGKMAKENVVAFKLRVIDLLDIYLRSREADWSIFLVAEGDREDSIIVRLLKIIRVRTRENKIRDRLVSLIRSIFDTSKHKGLNDQKEAQLNMPLPKESLFKTLEAIHNEVLCAGGGQLHMNACSKASLGVTKLLFTFDAVSEEVVEKITRLYADTMAKWLITGGIGVKGKKEYGGEKEGSPQIQGFLMEFVNWGGSIRKLTRPAKTDKRGKQKRVTGAYVGVEREKNHREEKRGMRKGEVEQKKDDVKGVEVDTMEVDDSEAILVSAPARAQQEPAGEGKKKKKEKKKREKQKEQEQEVLNDVAYTNTDDTKKEVHKKKGKSEEGKEKMKHKIEKGKKEKNEKFTESSSATNKRQIQDVLVIGDSGSLKKSRQKAV